MRPFCMFMPGVWFLSSKKRKFVIIFQKEKGNTFTLFIIFIVKSLQKEHNSTNLLLWPPICWNKPQSESTPRRLTLISPLCEKTFIAILLKSFIQITAIHCHNMTLWAAICYTCSHLLKSRGKFQQNLWRYVD